AASRAACCCWGSWRWWGTRPPRCPPASSPSSRRWPPGPSRWARLPSACRCGPTQLLLWGSSASARRRWRSGPWSSSCSTWGQ
ncbi:unnamed protein product, partial [Polarella glacialis]